eukprot:s532_g27.t1
MLGHVWTILGRFAFLGRFAQKEAMKDAQVSHAEVVEFRQVFNQLAIEAKTEMAEKEAQAQAALAASPGGRRRSMPDLSALAKPRRGIENDAVFQEIKASLFIGGRALCISVSTVIGMLRSLGVRISEKQLMELTNKVKDFAALDRGDRQAQEDAVDFAAFLRVIRWMLNVNFGDINSRAAARLGSKAKMPSRSRSAHNLDASSDLDMPPVSRRRRASVC